MLLCDVCSIVLWTRGPYEFPAAIVTGNWKWKCFFFFSRVPAAVLSVCSQWRPLPLFLTYCLIIPAAVMLASGKVISPPPSLFCGLHNTTPLVYLFFFFIVKRRFSFLHTESILRGSGRNRSSFFFVCSSDPRRLVFFIAPLLHTKERKKKRKNSFWESDWIIRSGHWLSFIISRMEKKKKRPVACCWWDVIALPSSSPPPPPSFFL